LSREADQPSQGVGAAALPRHPHLAAAQCFVDARERAAGTEPRRRATWAIMKRFKSPRQVQRFLSTHDQVANVFSRRPNQNTAAKFHSACHEAFAIWAEVTSVAMAA
jgi:hypothetical protein